MLYRHGLGTRVSGDHPCQDLLRNHKCNHSNKEKEDGEPSDDLHANFFVTWLSVSSF